MEKKNFLCADQYKILKIQLKELSLKGPIHVSLMRGRKKVDNVETKIVGVYDRFMCVQSMVSNYLEDFTVSYTDILNKGVQIKELSLE